MVGLSAVTMRGACRRICCILLRLFDAACYHRTCIVHYIYLVQYIFACTPILWGVLFNNNTNNHMTISQSIVKLH